MIVYQRVTAYKGRQDDWQEGTVLVPLAGAVHSDPFQVTNHPNLAGYKPYLDTVKIRHGELDPLTRKWSVGQATVRLLDVRTNANRNLQEWWCGAFLGDAKGRNQYLGVKMAIEESYDLGASWSLEFVGRVEESATDDALFWEFTLQDLAADLDVEIFGTRPHPSATGLIEPLIAPAGLSAAYGQVAAVPALSGTIGASSYTNQTAARVLTLDAASQNRLDNLITAALVNAVMVKVPSLGSLANWAAGIGTLLRNGALRCRISSASPSISNKELQVVQVIGMSRSDGHYAIKELLLTDLKNPDGTAATADPFYQAFDTGTVPNATAVTCTLRLGQPPLPVVRTDPPSAFGGGAVARRLRGTMSGTAAAEPETPPIMTSDVALMDFLEDLAKGYYAPRFGPGETLPTGSPAVAVGDPKFPFAYDTSGGSAWDQLKNATNRDPLPTTRWLIPQPWRMFDFLSKQVGQIFGVGYRFDPVVASGVPVCRFVPIDLRLPRAAAIAGIPTIADASLVKDDLPGWRQARASAISDLSVTYYNDVAITAQAVADLKEKIPAVPASLLTPVPSTALFLGIGGSRAIAIGARPLALEALGLRYTINGQDAVNSVQAEVAARAACDAVEAQYKSLFGAGAAFVEFVAPRSAVAGLRPGDWAYLAAAEVPSPGTNKRGDTRLVLLTSVQREEDLLLRRCRAIDAGSGAACSSPTIGTPTTMTGNTNHGISALLTANAQNDPMECRYLVDTTKALTTPPADTDSRWTFGLRVGATGTYSLLNLPSDVRVFPQVRAVPAPGQGSADAKLPSAWISPSGTKYVDTGAAAAPTSLAVSPGTILTGSTVTASWANPAGSVAFYIGVYLNSTQVATLAPNSVGLTLNPYLAANTAYTLEVRYFDSLTGRSPAASTSFTTPVGFGGPTLAAPTLALL